MVIAIIGWFAVRDKGTGTTVPPRGTTADAKRGDSALVVTPPSSRPTDPKASSPERAKPVDSVPPAIVRASPVKPAPQVPAKPVTQAAPQSDPTKAARVDAPVTISQRPTSTDATGRLAPSAQSVGPVTVPKGTAPTAQPGVVEPDPKPMDTPTAADSRAEAERLVGRIRGGAERPGDLAAFFSDGADHKISLAGAPTTVSENAAQGRIRVQFDIKLSKRDSFGISINRVATVSMDVIKRDGATSVASVAVGAVRKP